MRGGTRKVRRRASSPCVSTYFLVLIFLLLLLHAPSGGNPTLELQPALHHVLVRLAHLAGDRVRARVRSRGNVDRSVDFERRLVSKFNLRPLSRKTVVREQCCLTPSSPDIVLPRLIDCDAAVRTRARHSEATRTHHFAPRNISRTCRRDVARVSVPRSSSRGSR